MASLNAYKLGSLQHAVHFVRYNVTSVLMGPSLVASFPAQLVEALLLDLVETASNRLRKVIILQQKILSKPSASTFVRALSPSTGRASLSRDGEISNRLPRAFVFAPFS